MTLTLKTSEMEYWSTGELCSFFCAPKTKNGLGLRRSSAWVFYHVNFSGYELHWAIHEEDSLDLLQKLKLPEYFTLEIKRINNWAGKLDKEGTYEIERIDFSQRIGTTFTKKERDSYIETFNISMKLWAEKINDESSKQKEVLKGYFKNVFLPDRFEAFSRNDYAGWTGHFDPFRYPKNKGDNLREALASNVIVGRGDEQFTILLLIDLSTSGKTYTIFNLAQSRTDAVDRFFVVYLYPNSKLYKSLISSLKDVSAEVAVGLFCLSNHILLDILLENDAKLKPLEFFKFLRNGGDGSVVDIFCKLLDIIGNSSKFQRIIEEENFEYSKWFASKKSKVVFAFDEANNLTSHAVGTVDLSNSEKGNLFHAVYKEISLFNNPVFLGTTFQISEILISISEEGRKFTKQIVGEMNPWYCYDVKTVLKEKFNFNYSQKLPHLESLCYLLSGSPEHLISFHRLLLNNLKQGSTLSESIRKCLSIIVETKEDSTRKRLDRILSNTQEEVEQTILNLLFGEECVVPLDSLVNNVVGKAFIETAFAHVVQVGQTNLTFDIVDPISFSVYYKILFKNYRGKLWSHLHKNVRKRPAGHTFEYFMHLLLLEESENCETIRNSKLFANLPRKEFEQYTLKVTSFVRDAVFSKNSIDRNDRLPGLWITQTDGFMLDNIVKPDDNMGPDLVFYIFNQNNEKLLVSTAFSLVSDPKDDKYQPNKALRIFETTDPERFGVNKKGETTIEHLDYSPHNIGKEYSKSGEKCIRWMVCPFMKPVGSKWLKSNGFDQLAKPFDSRKHQLLWTTGDDIEQCVEQHKNKEYHTDMSSIWTFLKRDI